MKKAFTFMSVFFLFTIFNFFFLSCTQEAPQKAEVQKQVIQLEKEEIQKSSQAVYKTREFRGKERTYLSTDFSEVEKPSSLDKFTQHYHHSPVRQFWTGTCWCFATTSFLESELKRLGKGEIKLSEMYTVYWEYVDKARYFIQHKGDMHLGQGSEQNAVINRMKKYGAVPADAYTGLLPGETEHNHRDLFREFRNYLMFCKENEYWDKKKTVSYVKEILNKHMGKPPETIEVDGESMTPKEYMNNVLQLPLEDYVTMMSLKYLPFYTQGEYKVPDNWWHSKVYYNVPLDDFYEGISSALKKGYTVALGGDVSEPGKSGFEDIAIIPSYDIPFELINQDSREYRFDNRTTFDDHAIHAVGYTNLNDHTWFLIKDSGSSAQRGQYEGYYFYRDDYVKLKMLTYMVHKDAVSEILNKFEQTQ